MFIFISVSFLHFSEDKEFGKFKKFMAIKIFCEIAIVGFGTFIGIVL